MQQTQQQLETTNEQLQVLHRVFRHNIRNDMNIIYGYASDVRNELNDRFGDVYADLEIIQRRSMQIIEISEKIKVVDSVAPNPTIEQEIDLVPIIEEAIEEVRADFPDINVEAELDKSLVVSGGDAIFYAIREVLDNSAKHFDGPIEECVISISTSRLGSKVHLEIRDNGPGIPVAEIQPIRAGETSQLHHASSIGLWLVTWLSQSYGGDIEFESRSSRGTTVRFTFHGYRTASVFDIAKSQVAVG